MKARMTQENKTLPPKFVEQLDSVLALKKATFMSALEDGVKMQIAGFPKAVQVLIGTLDFKSLPLFVASLTTFCTQLNYVLDTPQNLGDCIAALGRMGSVRVVDSGAVPALIGPNPHATRSQVRLGNAPAGWTEPSSWNISGKTACLRGIFMVVIGGVVLALVGDNTFADMYYRNTITRIVTQGHVFALGLLALVVTTVYHKLQPMSEGQFPEGTSKYWNDAGEEQKWSFGGRALLKNLRLKLGLI